MKVRKNMIAIMLLACVGCMGCAKEQPKTDAGNESKSEDTRNTENGTEPGNTGSAAGKQDFPENFRSL